MGITFAPASPVKPAVKPSVNPSVKPVPMKAAARPVGRQWRERDPEAYRAYMRDYMRRRRAASKDTTP